MSPVSFRKAERSQSRGRIAIDGPAGAGKTLSALRLATALCPKDKRVAVIDTERGSASKYAPQLGTPADNIFTFDFDVIEFTLFSPHLYAEAIRAADEAGYAVLVIDSLSHAWEGEGGALDMVDHAATRIQGNTYMAWKDVTPEHRRMVDAILQSNMHVIVTMRSKMEYSQEKDDRGKTIVRKVGMAPVQRAGMEYEFDLVADMDVDHNFIVSKSRFAELDGAVQKKPDVAWFSIVKRCLESGKALPPVAAKPPQFVPAVKGALDLGEPPTEPQETDVPALIAAIRSDAAALSATPSDASKDARFKANAEKVVAKVLEDTDMRGDAVAAALAHALSGDTWASLTQGETRAIIRWLYDPENKVLRPTAQAELAAVLSAPEQKAIYDKGGEV